jgi:hypothetical protein
MSTYRYHGWAVDNDQQQFDQALGVANAKYMKHVEGDEN